MLQAAAAGPRSNTELTQPASGRTSRPRKAGRSSKGPRVTGEERESARQTDRPVIEMEHGITVYPPEADDEPWRAVFTENGARRFRQAATEAKLAEELKKVVEISGHLYSEAPKKRKVRRTIYPRRTPSGYPLVEKLAARIEAARGEQESGMNPLGLLFPSPTGKLWRASNFSRNVLKRAYLAADWRDANGEGRWVWHSLRHVFRTTALFTWKLDPTDVSRMAGHANYRTTLDLYVGTTAGILERARTATE